MRRTLNLFKKLNYQSAFKFTSETEQHFAQPYKLAVTFSKSYDKKYLAEENRKLARPLDLTFFENEMNPALAKTLVDFNGVCGFVNDDFSAPVLKKLKARGIDLIALRCAGYDNVDLDAADQLGIRVVRVPSYRKYVLHSPSAIAEHAAGLMLTLNRKLHKAYNRTRDGNFSLEGLIGMTLRGKTVGIFGIGKIGQCFASICKGLGLNILIHDKWQPPQSLLDEFGATFVDQDTLWRESDIISLHCPLFKETQHIINRHSLKKMKENVIIVNTSRGALINTDVAIDALRTRRIGGLALDVYEKEKGIFFNDLSGDIMGDENLQLLQSFPNVIITAHQAFLTEEALQEICRVTLDNITQIRNDGQCPNMVHKD